MKVHQLPFRETGYFSAMICDYLDNKVDLRPFFGNFTDNTGFSNQLKDKSTAYKESTRKELVASLKSQIEHTNTSDETKRNIDKLSGLQTFTVTTGHQLNLMTGPLYFLYKIGTAINLARKLKTIFPKYDFVPVYWMATEDHDFDEINFFNFKDQKVVWDKNAVGAVGRLDTDGLDKVFDSWSASLGSSENAAYLKDLFKSAYLEHNSLAAATRHLVNALFGDKGLVIIDGDSEKLKHLMIPNMRDELLNTSSFNEVSKTNESLKHVGSIQVNPRRINLFYLKDNLRERIVKEDDGDYRINGTAIKFTEEEILAELEKYPERFSPNVIMRPLFQEMVLPNLCYIGGGGELAYWIQLKSYFLNQDIPFPILMLRQSLAFITKKQLKKAERLSLSLKDLFEKQDSLVNAYVHRYSEIAIDFNPQRSYLKEQFEELKELAKKTDPSFLGAVLAQEKKQLNGLDKLEKRLLKAQKRKMNEVVSRIKLLQDAVFPNRSLEERTRNFTEIYLSYGPKLIDDLLEVIDPFSKNFTVVEI